MDFSTCMKIQIDLNQQQSLLIAVVGIFIAVFIVLDVKVKYDVILKQLQQFLG